MNESKAKNEMVYQALKSDIINGAYPAGFHLDREALRKKYGYSTTPTNIALVRLFNEGLLEKRGRDGFYTRNSTVTEIRETYLSTGAILKLAAAEFFLSCPHVPLKFQFKPDMDVVAKTEALFEAVAGLLGPFVFHGILKANNDRLHLIRKSKGKLIGDAGKELSSLIDALEARNLELWCTRVDSYVTRRIEMATELTQLMQQTHRAL